VDVDAPPLVAGQEPPLPPGGRRLTLPGPGGRRFSCVVPPPPPADAAEAAEAAAAAALAAAPSPAALISSLDGTCLYRMEDWWTYEFCAGKHARQFHREADGSGGPGAVVAEYLLGAADEGAHPPDPAVRADPSGPPEEGLAYIAQEYGGGQACDLTGTARGVEVRFVCADAGGGGGAGAGGDGGRLAGGSHLDGPGPAPPPVGPRDALLAIREPSTCRYTFTVGVADLCAHPAFKISTPPTLAVRCVEVGGEEEEAESGGVVEGA